ncbi:MAG: hypothetical protein JWM99_4870 [Verrucomicrobiales bacterium]|nr:hypothetical protein [Verrucomicrobiales bacterium]
MVVALVNQPDLPVESKSNDRDYQWIFDEHFLLITGANCAELMNRYRKLYGSGIKAAA